MTKNVCESFRTKLRTYAWGGIAALLGAALLTFWKSEVLYGAESGDTTADSRTAAAISELKEKIRGEMERIKAVEHRLDAMGHPESQTDEISRLREEIRSGRSRIEALETSLNKLPELVPPAAAAGPPPAKAADTPQPTVTVGAGIQGSYQHFAPDGGKGVDQFSLDHARIYLSGDITSNISAMFNTDYNSVTNQMRILDAVGQIHVSPKLNVWLGRFLPPSDRANLYGPFFSHEWAVFTDGIQDGYPFVFQGRDNGAMYWGDFKAGTAKIKVSVGGFDGLSATGNSDFLGAARVQVDFWDEESGYYLNGTYYGDKNLLAIGAATQWQSGNTATTLDFLMEKKLPNKGVVSFESEYSNYNSLGGYDPNYAKSQGAYALASYLFPKQVGIGKFEILGKYAIAEFTRGRPPSTNRPSYRQDTTELNFNYIIKQFDARIMSFYKNTRFNNVFPITGNTDSWAAGVGLQIQLSKPIH